MSLDMFAFLRRGTASQSVPVVDAALVDVGLLEALADAHDAAAADADAAFTPERAAALKTAILARLGASDDPRVLSFPPRAIEASEVVSRRPAAPKPALGWMLTAAAAGLVVGVGTGQGIHLEWPRQAPVQALATVTPVRTTAVDADTDQDDAILGEVEVALSSRGVDELQPLDAITPRVTLVASR